MSKKIIAYASVGNNVPTHLIGGGETGTRRTVKILTDAGYDVNVIDKAIFGMGGKHYIEMIVQAYKKFKAAIKADKNAIVFVVGYYERNLWFEWLLLSIARRKGHKTVYEARNGRLVTAYNSRGRLYKKMMLSVLKNADAVLCQGQEYVEFIKEKVGKEGVYIPNYVMDINLQPYHDRNFDSGINLVYFGRLVPSKNIDMIIRTVFELKQRGEKAHLYLIGGSEAEYKFSLERLVEKEGLNGEVEFIDHIPFSEMTDILQTCHFFIFPSQEIKEGHSNSLTEAMSFGIVPLVSTAGFSPSIVNEPYLVVQKIDEKKYSRKILEIIKNDKWDALSRRMFKRVRSFYTETCVKQKIKDVFWTLTQQ